MGKHSKPAKPRRPGLLWLILVGLWREAKTKAATRFRAATGSREVARASQEWIEGEYCGLRPTLQPYPWRHYVAPEDLERYAANIGGFEFAFELWPESGHELRQAAYDAAAEHWGPYVDSQPLVYLEADNDAARAVLPAPIS